MLRFVCVWVCMSVCVSGSVGVQYVPDGVCVCMRVFCDIWSGCHAYRTLCKNCGDRIIDLKGLSLYCCLHVGYSDCTVSV